MASPEKSRPRITRDLSLEEKQTIERIPGPGEGQFGIPAKPKPVKEEQVVRGPEGYEVLPPAADIGPVEKKTTLLERTLGPEYAEFFTMDELKLIARAFKENIAPLFSDPFFEESEAPMRGKMLAHTIRRIADRVKEKYSAEAWRAMDADGRKIAISIIVDEIYPKKNT